MVGIVLERGFDQAFYANPRSAAAQAKRAQGREPVGPPRVAHAQSSPVAARACPDFLIRWSRRIEIRQYVKLPALVDT